MTASRRPFFRARKVRWEDADGDGFLQAGEVMRIIVDLENVWKETAAVSATLSISGSTMATLVSGSSTFGSMASGATKNNQSNPFLMRIGTLPYALASLGCVITIQADGYRQTLPRPASRQTRSSGWIPGTATRTSTAIAWRASRSAG